MFEGPLILPPHVPFPVGGEPAEVRSQKAPARVPGNQLLSSDFQLPTLASSPIDTAIVGGGVIGTAIARELARAGAEVVVIERDPSGPSASWAAAGMLSPLAEADEADDFLALLLDSRRLYPEFVAELEAETGEVVGYRSEGTLLAALDAADERALRSRFAWQRAAGLPVEWLNPEEALAAEPALNPELRAALQFPDDHQVDNRLLAAALRQAAIRAGVRMRMGETATAVLQESGRAAGVALEGGERIPERTVVIAGGAASPAIAGLPRPLPVRPVHGQLLALRPSTSEPLIRHVVDSPRIYLVPRSDGRVIVGATVEEVGFRSGVTAGGVHALLSAALELVPALADAPLVESWSGHRPGTPDGKPVLGADPELPGLIYATGHYRNGILLTPITALAVSDLILGRTPRHDLAPFGVERFGESE